MSHNGYQFVAEEVTRHETGPSVVMNCTAYNDGKRTWIAAGQESHCQLYNVNSKVVTIKNEEIIKEDDVDDGNDNLKGKKHLRHRKRSGEIVENIISKEKIEEIKDDNSNIRSKKLQLIVKPADSVQTDFR